MLPITPALTLPSGWEDTVYAEHQDQYLPLPVLRSLDQTRKVVSRWALNAEERAKIADGEDVFLTMLTYGNPLQPVFLGVGVPMLLPVEPAPTTDEVLKDRLKGAVHQSERLDVVGTEGGKASLPSKAG